MTGFLRRGQAIAALVAAAAAGPAHATPVCGWLQESVDADEAHMFDLWLSSDGFLDFVYQMKGQGVTTPSSRMYSPGSGSFSLRPGKDEKAWGFGTSLDPGSDIDIIAELHLKPKDIFSEDETPLLATFTFKRHVPDDETKPPPVFMEKQCVTLPPDSPAIDHGD